MYIIKGTAIYFGQWHKGHNAPRDFVSLKKVLKFLKLRENIWVKTLSSLSLIWLFTKDKETAEKTECICVFSP